MSQTDTPTFTFEDRWGAKHTYMVSLHGATAGSRVALKLLGLAGPALGNVIRSLLSSDMTLSDLLDVKLPELKEIAEVELKEEEDGSILRIAGLLDFRVLGQEIQSTMMREDNVDLLMQILRHTSRDGQMLDKDGEFDRAYRGNYLELAKAAWEVVRINGFLLLFST